MKVKVICIEGRWNDERTQPHNRFERKCAVLPAGLSDTQRDDVLLEISESDTLFYVFEHDEDILGQHLDFVVDFYNPLFEIELGEMK